MSLSDLLASRAQGAAEHVVAFSFARQRVLADNLANIDTPGYRMRDLSESTFQQTLQRALHQSRRAYPNLGRLELPSVAELERSPEAAAASGLRGIVFHDDNDRNIETLMAQLNETRTRLNHAVSLLRAQTRLLRTVISERVSA